MLIIHKSYYHLSDHYSISPFILSPLNTTIILGNGAGDFEDLSDNS